MGFWEKAKKKKKKKKFLWDIGKTKRRRFPCFA